MSVTDTLVDFALAPAQPTERMHRITLLSLFDWCVVSLAGRDEPVAAAVRAYVAQNGGTPESSAIGSTLAMPATSAALVNGTVSHALDYDDTHFDYIGHPSVAVIPAALAVAEATQASDTALLEALVVGLETVTRVGRWLGRGHYAAGFHITGTAGSVGATVAAARLLGLAPAQVANALSLVASRASGLRTQFGSMAKPWHAGLAASNGVEAARLALHGVVPAPDALAAHQGLSDTHRGDADATAFDGLSTAFRFEDVTHKFHACCHGTHAMIDALLSLCAGQPIDPADVDAVTVRVTPAFQHVCNQLAPDTGLGAKFSYRLLAAATLCGHDTARLDTYTDALCHDPAVVGLRDKVVIEFDSAVAETAADVTVHARGRSNTATADLLDSDFLADTPAREGRVRAKAASVVGAERAATLWQHVTEPRDEPLRALPGALNR
ncbi:MAG: MmgE/PrpD family protein [Pseudomonadota bacterium]